MKIGISKEMGWENAIAFIISFVAINLIFIRGFLHSKLEITEKSSEPFSLLGKYLNPQNIIETKHLLNKLMDRENSLPRQYEQVAWLVVDSLPYFLIRKQNNSSQELFPKLHQLTEDQKYSCSIYAFLAHQPTMTFSRVEAFGTGSIPPFLKMAKSFQVENLEEDTIFEQMHRSKLSMITKGNELWAQMFPRDYYFELRTISGHHLYNTDQQAMVDQGNDFNRKDWNFHVTHVDYLDHIFHRQGPFSDFAQRKLLDLDSFLERMTHKMNPKTLYLVFGDHGNHDGFHGGGTKEELEAGLFVYSTSNFTFKLFSNPEEVKRMNAKDGYLTQLMKEKGIKFEWEGRYIIPQIDIVPTMSRALGFSIPFTNLGQIFPEIMNYYPALSVGGSIHQLFIDHMLNYLQMYNYISKYAQMQNQFEDYHQKHEIIFRKELKEEFIQIIESYCDIEALETIFKQPEHRNSLDPEQEQLFINFVSRNMNMANKLRDIMTKMTAFWEKEFVSTEYSFFALSEILQFLLFFTQILILVYSHMLNSKELNSERRSKDHMFSRGLYSIYGFLLQFGLFIMLYLYPSTIYLVFLVTLVYLSLNLWNIGLLIYHSQFNMDKIARFAVIIAAILMIYKGSSSYNEFYKNEHIPLRYLTLALPLLLFIFSLGKRAFSWKIITSCIAISVLCQVAFHIHPINRKSFSTGIIAIFLQNDIGKNYLLSTILPYIIIMLIILKIVLNSSTFCRGIKQRMIGLWKYIFIGNSVLSLLYSIYEGYSKIEDSEWMIKVFTPRLVFVIYFGQFVYIIYELTLKGDIFIPNSRLESRVIGCLALIIGMGIPPNVMIAGPGQHIMFLIFICILAAIYIMGQQMLHLGRNPSLHNSVLFHTGIAIILYFYFFASGHYLDIQEGLRLHRGFVGLPEFNFVSSLALIFFDTMGPLYLIILAYLMLTLTLNAEEFSIIQGFSPKFAQVPLEEGGSLHPEFTPELESPVDTFHVPRKFKVIQEHIPPQGIAAGREEAAKLLITVVKIFLTIIIVFEFSHMMSIIRLIEHFKDLFFFIFPKSLVLKIFCWTLYWLAIFVFFIINRIHLQIN